MKKVQNWRDNPVLNPLDFECSELVDGRIDFLTVIRRNSRRKEVEHRFFMSINRHRVRPFSDDPRPLVDPILDVGFRVALDIEVVNSLLLAFWLECVVILAEIIDCARR